MFGEPDRVAALAGADVKSRAGGQAGDLVDEGSVRVAAPPLFAAVPMVPVGLVGRCSAAVLQVVFGQVKTDHGGDFATCRCCGQHLLAGVGDVAGSVETRHVGRPVRVGLDIVAQSAGVHDRVQPQRVERFDPGLEPWADQNGIGGNPASVAQFDGNEQAPVIGNDLGDLPPHDVCPAGAQCVELSFIDGPVVVDDQGVSVGELADQPGGVQAHRVGEDLNDALVAGFVTVAERAVDDSVSPLLREAIDVGQLIHGAGRGKDASGNDRVPTDELDAQAAFAVAGNTVGSSRDDFTAIAADLLLPCAQQLRGRYPLMAQVAVYARGGGVARFAGIDDDDRPSLPSQLQRGAQASG